MVYHLPLDRFIGYAVDHDAMDIASFKGILREYNARKLELPDKDEHVDTTEDTGQYRDDDPALLRDCDYYEKNVGGHSYV